MKGKFFLIIILALTVVLVSWKTGGSSNLKRYRIDADCRKSPDIFEPLKWRPHRR